MLKLNNASKFIVSLAVSFLAGGLGSLATFANIPTWYAGLSKPVFNPPNWVFGPVWTLLYALMGISLYLMWTSISKKSKRSAFTFFGAQLVLNALWSLAFFGLHWPWGGVVIIVLLLVVIVLTIRSFLPISRSAAYLLIPYLTWVSFAAILNIAVGLIN